MVRILLALLALSATAVAVKNFHVTDDEGMSCIIIEADIEATLKFVNTSKNITQQYQAKLAKVQGVTGSCNATHGNVSAQTISITFLPEGYSARFAKEWVLDMVFGSPADAEYQLIDYTLTTQKTAVIPYFGDFIRDPNADENVAASDPNAYKCSASQLDLMGGSSVHLKNLRLVAYGAVNGTTLPENNPYELCTQDSRTSDVVPIVVGACLAALVVVVLVAYLIGRARAKRAGYASV